LFKLPTFKSTSPSLAIEINPVSSSTGAVTKKRGIIIRSGLELEEIIRLLSNPKVAQLAKNIDEVNPQKASTTSSNEVFEI
jgi:C4-type Zn-finger protein